MPRSYVTSLLLAFALSSSLQCAQGELVTSVAQLDGLGGGPHEVDLLLRVNYWDQGWGDLYLQLGDRVLFADLPYSHSQEPPFEIPLGSQVRITGRLKPDSTIDADPPRLIANVAPSPSVPVEVDLDAMASVDDHWGQRAIVTATVESVLIRRGRAQFVMQAGNTRFLARVQRSFELRKQHQAQSLSLVGAQVRFTGTMSSLSDTSNLALGPQSVLLLCMPGDGFEILKPGPSQQSIEKINVDEVPRILAEGESNASYEVHGQIAFLHKYDYFLLEDETDNVTIYAPFEGDLKIGDSVRVIARNASPARPSLPEIFKAADSKGEQADLIAQVVFLDHSSFLPPPIIQNAAEIVANQVNRQRRSIDGEFVARLDSQGTDHFVLLKQGDFKFVANFRGDQSILDALELSTAKRLRVQGLVMQPGPPMLDSAFLIQLDGPYDSSDFVVTERWGQVDLRIVLPLVATLVSLVVGGTIIVLLLKRRVGSQEKNLASVMARLNSSYDAVQEALLVVEHGGVVIGVNSKVPKVLGIEIESFLETDEEGDCAEALRDRVSERFEKPEEFAALWDRAQSNRDETLGLELVTVDDAPRHLVIHTAPVLNQLAQPEARIWAFTDISERKRLEANLVHSQKMEAVGRLAGGVAHDFNNLLMAMSSNVELARLQPELTVAEADTFLEEVDRSTQRAQQLINHLLGFSRKTKLETRSRQPNDVVTQVVNLLKRTLDPGISLRMENARDLWYARLDETQLEQVLLNICLNARDALVDGKGWIRVDTANVAAANSPLMLDSVRIGIVDNGVGISDKIMANIYDPFFSTKERGKGTGLGLAMSIGIVEQHEGTIVCESELGQGTRFDVFLPQCDEPEQPPSCVPSGTTRPVQAERRHILIAEDEPVIRNSVGSALQMFGMQVTTVCNGQEAVDFLAHSALVDIVLLDLSMPVMSGGEALEVIGPLYPDLPVIIYSGYVNELKAIQDKSGKGPFAVISKPFKLKALLELINDALEAVRAS